MMSNKTQLDMSTILDRAQSDIMALAAEVGIDAQSFLTHLPLPGQLVTGSHVPVTHKKYRGTCSVLFYLNQSDSGQDWPYFRFHTFKHGGVTTEFNGLEWLNRNKQCVASTTKNKPNATSYHRIEMTEALSRINQQEDDDREARFNVLSKQYNIAKKEVFAWWLDKRLVGYACVALLDRMAMRSWQNKILIPLTHDQNGITGFHQIKCSEDGDEKRHFVRKRGALKGSYVQINKLFYSPNLPIAICEGVATGLALALVWPGEIRVALSAANITEVRKEISDNVIIFCDKDVWKPEVGNVGKNSAIAASQQDDLIVSPTFSCRSYGRQPTDFNDLLMIDGFESLSEQVSLVLKQFI